MRLEEKLAWETARLIRDANKIGSISSERSNSEIYVRYLRKGDSATIYAANIDSGMFFFSVIEPDGIGIDFAKTSRFVEDAKDKFLEIL